MNQTDKKVNQQHSNLKTTQRYLSEKKFDRKGLVTTQRYLSEDDFSGNKKK